MKNVTKFFKLLGLSALLIISCTSKPVRMAQKQLNPVSYGQDSIRKEASTSVYETNGLCNGLPKVSVKTPAGFCLGLVDNGEGLTKPRYAYPLDADHLLLSDMGGWRANNGKYFLLTRAGKKWSRKLLFDSSSLSDSKKCVLDRPHQIILGPEQEIYLTGAACIATIKWPLAGSIENSISVKVSGLPLEGLHPIKAIAFDDQKNMLMNVGSITDNCELETSDRCKETEDDPARAVAPQRARRRDG